MELKTLNWTLALVIIACYFNAVFSDDNTDSSSTVSSFSSSSSELPVPSHAVKGQQRGSSNVTQIRKVVYKRTRTRTRVPGSKTVVMRSASHVYINGTVETVVINASSINIFPTHQYVKVTEYVSIIPSHVILSLQVADRFRSNLIYIIGYLLQSRNSDLTLQQYSSLKLIYNALQRKQVQMHRLLPVLINLRGETKSVQFHVIMQELSTYLPLYYTCSATFWVGQVLHNVFNIDTVLVKEQEKFDLFTSISAQEIEIVRNFNGSYETEAYDYNSRLTEATLGRVYVKIFQSINIHQLHLSQQLFALILRNLPNPDGDVAFEEYIQLVAEVAWRREIPNWEQIGINPKAINPFILIDTIAERINQDEKVSAIIRQAMIYVRTHLLNQQQYVMKAQETYLITGQGGLNIAYLLSVITDGDFNKNAVEMKEILLEFAYSHRDVIEFILKGMNRYAYISTQELLQVFLIRLRTRLPNEYVEIRKVVYRLLMIVERKLIVWQPHEISPEDTTPQPSSTDRPSDSTEYSTPSAQPGVTDYSSIHTEEVTAVTQPGTEHPSGSTEYSTPSAQPGVTDYSSSHTEEGTDVTHPVTEHPSGSTEYSTPSAQPGVTDYSSIHTEEVTAVTQPGTEHPSGSTEYSTPSAQPGVTDYSSSHTEESTDVTHPVTEHPSGSTEYSTPSAQPGVTDYSSSHTEEGTDVTHPVTEHPSGSTEYSTSSAQPGVTDYSSSHTEEGTDVTHPVTEHPSGSTEYSTSSAQPGVTDYSSSHTEEGTDVTHPVTEHPSGSTEYSTSSAQPGVTDYSSSHTEEGTEVTHPVTEHPSGSTEYSTPSTQPGVTDYSSIHTEEGTDVTHPVTEHPSGSTEYSTLSAQPDVTDYSSSHTEEGTDVTHPVTEHPSGSTEYSTPSAQPGVTDYSSIHTEEGTDVTHPVTEHPSGSTEYSTPSAQPGVTDYSSSHTEEGTDVTHPVTEHPSGSTEYSTPSAQPGVTDYSSSQTEEGTDVTHPVTEHPSGSTEYSTPSAQPGVTDYSSSHPEEGTDVTHPVTEHPSGSTEYSTSSAQPGVTDYSSSHTEEGTDVTHPVTEHPSGSTEYSTPSAQPGVTDYSSSQTEEGTDVTHPVTEHPSGSTEYSTPSAQSGVTDYSSSSIEYSATTQTGVNVNGSTITIGSVSTSPGASTTTWPTESPTIGPIIPSGVPLVPKGVDVLKVIYIEITEYGIPNFKFGSNNASKNVVTVPSPDCLRKAPSDGSSQDNCQTDTEIYITTHLIKTFGNDYIRVILGDNWRELYPTKISYLLALLEKVETYTTIQSQQELIIIIKRYRTAIKTIATYVFLPLIVQQQEINTQIVWSTFDYSNPSTSYIGSFRPTDNGTDIITLPLVNPKYWLLPVDLNDPYKGLFPVLPEDDPDAHKLDILVKIFSTEEIHKWLGVEWNPSVYPNRGALFISALRILLKREEVRINTELYILIRNYLRAIELPAVHIQIPPKYWEHTIIRTASSRIIIPNLRKSVPEIDIVIPAMVNPNTMIQLAVSDLGIPSVEFLATYKGNLSISNVVTMPSVVCLLQAPSNGHAQDKCEIDVDVQIRNIFIQTFGERYIEEILGDNAVHIYPTRISLLIALLEQVQNNTKIAQQVEILKIIRKYEIALKSVASYILLPLSVHYQEITNIVVWFTYDRRNPSQTNITVVPTYQDDENIITLPLINPITWLLEVDTMRPFSGLVPRFVERQSPYAIQIEPITQLIRSGQIYELFDSNWKVSQYPNRGALYISVLYKLLTVDKVKADQRLYTLLQQYLKVFESLSINIYITTEYLETMINRWKIEYDQFVRHEDPIVANATARDDILLPALISPNKDLKVTMKSSTRIFVQSSKVLEELSPDTLTLPSVNCLQAFPDQDDDEYCEQFPDLPMLPQLRKTLGDAGTENMMNENWDSEYPTMVSFLQNLCLKAVKNEKVAKDTELVADIERYRAALEFAAATIFLPLLTNYQEIDVELIWLTYDTTDYRQSHMSLHRPEWENQNVITLPLVNPKVWLQSVNDEHPFTSFLPILPSSDPYSVKIKPLLELFNSGEILLILGKNFTAINYPNRGALFVATLQTLLSSTNVASNQELHTLVKNYLNVIQVVSLYVHIPRSWINNGYTKAQYRWTVDVADLYTALPTPQSAAEFRYYYRIRSFLTEADLLQKLKMHLPTLRTYKAEFLIMIINRLLTSDSVSLTKELVAALKHYSAKAELALVARGGVVRWIWVARTPGRFRQTTEPYDIGKIYISTIPLSRLRTKEDKIHYFKLIKFMNDNREFLNTDDFMYKRYPNHGQFLRAYLNHLVRRPNIDKNAKEYINTVVEFIRNTGPGAVPIPVKRKKITN